MRKRWVATLDSRTRPSHRALDGKVIGVGGRFPNGCRYPGDPQGPAWGVWNCRCTLVPDMEGYDAMASGRYDKNLKGISYEDWKAGKNPPEPKRGSGRSLRAFMAEPSVQRRLAKRGISEAQVRNAIGAELARQGRDGRAFPSLTRSEQQAVLSGAISQTRKAPDKKREVKPVSPALYNSQRNYVLRHGGEVTRGGEDAERLLAYLGVDGCLVDGVTVVLHGTPTASEVLEECYHFRQYQHGEYADVADPDERKPRRVIDAQEYLLGVTELYKKPNSEVEQTRANLARYQQEPQVLMGGAGHEGA